MNNASEICQDESSLLNMLTTEEKKKQKSLYLWYFIIYKGQKFVPTANKIDLAELKTKLEECGRHFCSTLEMMSDIL